MECECDMYVLEPHGEHTSGEADVSVVFENPLCLQMAKNVLEKDLLELIFGGESIFYSEKLLLVEKDEAGKHDTDRIWELRVEINSITNWSHDDYVDWQKTIVQKIFIKLSNAGFKVNYDENSMKEIRDAILGSFNRGDDI